MISQAEVDRARSASIVALVASVSKIGRDDKALCPFHDEHTPSLHVYRKTNSFYCFGCGVGGDSIEFLRLLKALDFAGTIDALCDGRPHVTFPPDSRKAPPVPPAVPSLVLELWRGADAPNLVRWYLESRGITQRIVPESLRGHRAVWCKESRRPRPCVLAAVSGPDGAITAVQRIWIEDRLEYDGARSYEKGARCLDLRAGKKTIGPLGHGAVKLAAAGPVLGLSEGVENALAAAMLYRIPTWATCGTSQLGKVELPDIVRHVVIFADNDAPGLAAAAKAESAYRRRGYGAQVEIPERKDFAAMLLR